MNCNCIKDLEEKLSVQLNGEGDFGNLKPKHAKLKSISVTNAALMVRDLKFKLQIPFTANWTLVGGREKTTPINIIASHCPFCGKPMESTEKETA